jgi:UDP-3-O-[3-hydroxymyristoyl] glucosamine N-acyltransferase
MQADDLARWLDGELLGEPSLEIERVSRIEEASAGDVTFLANPRYRKHLSSTQASALLISRGERLPEEIGDLSRRRLALIRVADPYLAFLYCVRRFTGGAGPVPHGIHATALVPPSARLKEGVALGAYVVIGERASVGERTVISHGSIVGEDVEIGPDSVIHPNVTIYHGCKLGERVVVHSGAVIGSDGFGFAPKPEGTYEKIPQAGIVVIQDEVEIGANTCIDRATLGETVIHRGVKLDNLIHIAHNAVVGEDTVMAAQVGISGSTKIGRRSMLGGQVGLIGHLEIAERTTFFAQAGVTRSVRKPGTKLSGYPARDHREALRRDAAAARLPELVEQIRELRARVARLEATSRKRRKTSP